MSALSNIMLPLVVLSVIIYGLLKRQDIYASFINGAQEGMGIAVNIFPYLLGMVFAVNLLTKSNAINYFVDAIKPILNFLMIPVEIVPLSLIRPISANAALALLNDIYATYGVDSIIGYIASVIQGSTDTTIYILTLYFGSIGIKKVKHALWVGLLCDLVAVIVSIAVVNLFF